jgi:hypothetical protein
MYKEEKIPEKAYEKLLVNVEKLKNVNHSLTYLAEAFFITGNSKISNKMWNLHSEICTVIEYLTLGQSQIVDEGCKQAAQNSINILNATLARIDLEKENK